MPNGDYAAAHGQITAFIERAKAMAGGGLTVDEFGTLAVDLMRLSIAMLDKLAGPGVDKKAMVLDAVGELFDAVADQCVPLVAWPVYLLFRPALRSLALALAAGAIESLLPMIRGGS
jgi:hypothetical protein